MRLDHLLSTEIMKFLCVVCAGVVSAGPAVWPDGVGVLAWNGLEAVAWMRCWVPGSPPCLGGVPVARLVPAWGVAPWRVLAARWWLENWIVDASGWLALGWLSAVLFRPSLCC